MGATYRHLQARQRAEMDAFKRAQAEEMQKMKSAPERRKWSISSGRPM